MMERSKEKKKTEIRKESLCTDGYQHQNTLQQTFLKQLVGVGEDDTTTAQAELVCQKLFESERFTAGLHDRQCM